MCSIFNSSDASKAFDSDYLRKFFFRFLAAQAALYLPLSLIHSFICYVEFIPNHTNLSRLFFAKPNAAHRQERTMPHTMFNNLDDLNNLNNFNNLDNFNSLNNLNNFNIPSFFPTKDIFYNSDFK